MFGAVLRSSREHFDDVVVQAIEELALEAPFELGMIQIARVQIKIIRVHQDRGILELNDDLNSIALASSGEFESWMFIKPQLVQDSA